MVHNLTKNNQKIFVFARLINLSMSIIKMVLKLSHIGPTNSAVVASNPVGDANNNINN